MSEELYKQAASQAHAPAAQRVPARRSPAPEPARGAQQRRGRETGKDDVVDAEFEIVDEDKKK